MTDWRTGLLTAALAAALGACQTAPGAGVREAGAGTETAEVTLGTGTEALEVPPETETEAAGTADSVTAGTEYYRGFLMDNVLHSPQYGDIHYHVYIPDSYDGSRPYALFFTLPGYEGLYFQGMGENLYQEQFAFEAMKYNSEMIIVAPQLEDWGEMSASQTIVLANYFLSHYNIDQTKVYGEGYSGGGETMSQVLGMAPGLFSAYLHCSSQWDGSLKAVADSRTPVYLAVGENDEYYGSEPSGRAYEELYGYYRDAGLSEEEIGQLLVLDIKDAAWFESRGASNQHGGGGLFAEDEEIMGWLFDR